MTFDKNSSDYSPVSQHGIDFADPTRNSIHSRAADFFRQRKNLIIAGIIGSVVVIIAIIAITVTVVNVSSHDPKPEKLQASCLNLNAPSEKDYKFSHSSNLVDLRLFDQVLEKSPKDQNIVFSSLSVISVLSMVLLGSKHQTRDELAMVLSLPCNEIENGASEIYFGKYKIAHELMKNDNVKIETANKVYIDNHFQLMKDFTSKVGNYFSSQPELLDFASNSNEARIKINNDVMDLTNEKIKDLLGPGSVTPNTKMILVNAVYFKGDWMYEFDKKQTNETGEFILSSGSSVQVPMMKLKAYLRSGILPDNSGTVIELPYKGKQMSMYLIAPFDDNIKCTNHLFKTVIQLEDENFDNLLDSEVLTTLEMPKFKIEFELDSMKSLLNNIGLKSVFQPHSADLTGFNPNITNLYIDDIVQKAFIEVNEEGTEAAAATGVIMKTAMIPNVQKKFVLNRPFLYFIRDHKTSVTLFNGRVMNPKN